MGSHVSAFGGEIDKIRLATGRATNPDQPSRFQRSQAMTDIALVISSELHQFQVPHAHTTLGALILGDHMFQDVTLQP